MSRMINVDGFKLKSKKLKSGNYQVTFYLKDEKGKSKYGYMLAKPRMSVREVVLMIYSEIKRKPEMHLYSIDKEFQSTNVWVF